ncbi:MAG TPA: hypothetical protein VFZ25_10055 [Chloroflexota bacterium]|nr:hypothetical protein [Chloroflexota bacterium]
MAIRIQRLNCNVTVQALPSSAAPTESAIASRDLSTWPTASPTPAVQRALEAGDSASANNPASDAAETSPGGAVDPRKLADKVYQLMLDDLRIARERE